MDEMALYILVHPFRSEAFISAPKGSIPHDASI